MKPVYPLLVILLLLNMPVLNAQGVYQFWGMTAAGGKDNIGSIFTTDGSGGNFYSRHQFSNLSSGGAPQNTETVEYNGKFYGMTENGGAMGVGVIFEWDPVSNVYNKKIDFNGINGSYPFGSLTMKDGKFYGMTDQGGAYDKGVIFEWNPLTNLYSKKFDLNDIDGSGPSGSLTLYAGKFYGMTSEGGNEGLGVIFEWDPTTNIYTKKKEFVAAEGAYPFGSFRINNGKLYGMTSQGGNNNGGVIFEWEPVTNTYTKKFDFGGSNGYGPQGSLTFKDDKFYGMTLLGGTDSKGVIFEWDPASNDFTKKIDLNAFIGYAPFGNLTLNAGKFYGMTSKGGNGGNNAGGVIFEWNPATNDFNKKIDFNGSNGKNPKGSFTAKDGKLYSMTSSGGSNGSGIIFEWDPATNDYAKKIDFNNTNGTSPAGSLTRYNGKFYGMSNLGGSNNKGVIFEWDPATDLYTKKIDFGGTNGEMPQGGLTLYMGKFYGMTNLGGSNNKGIIFEWNPSTNVYTKKIDLSNARGSAPYGNLSLSGGKFYGMTSQGGTNLGGVIFEWDPTGNVYTKKIDLGSDDGKTPYGSLTLSDGKFYGMTNQGGTEGQGVIFEWNPATNVYTKKISLDETGGSKPIGSLTQYGDKFYGMTNQGGADGLGVIFEWDLATNVYSKKKDLYITTGYGPVFGNNLVSAPAPVAKGLPGSCMGFPSITINGSNNNKWVAITDWKGEAIAEIKANGNNLGIVTAAVFINNTAVRQDGSTRLYLDRNITITPQFPLTMGASADIRLYVRNSEFQSLKTAVNSMGQPSGINNIDDLGIYKNNDGCSASVSLIANPVITTAANWETDYVLSANISSFSSFYFASKAQGGPLPVTTIELNARLVDNNGQLTWNTTDEFNTASFSLERSLDGRNYTALTTVAAINQIGNHRYYYTDKNIDALAAPVIFYRVKENDIDGKFSYSAVVTLSTRANSSISIYPNPVADKATISISTDKPEPVHVRIIDNAGRVVKQQQWNISAGNNVMSVPVNNLAKGIYYLELKSGTINEHKTFIKQ